LQHDEDTLVASALVVLVVGTRPPLAPFQVRRFVQDNYGLAASDFTLHRYWPEDFLLIFRNPSDVQRVLNAPPLPRADMVLRFRRWNRLSTAEGESMRYRVLVELRGVPSHAWSVATAQAILGDVCATPLLTPTTMARADLRRFQAIVWCSDPDHIPNEAVIRVPEKIVGLGNNNIFLWPEQIIHHSLPLLRYKVQIEILEVQDWNDSSSSDDSDTLPDRVLTDSDDDEDYPGFPQPSRSRPLPRRTVFRTPGFGDGSENTTGGGVASGTDVPSNSLPFAWSLPYPIRFGSFSPAKLQQPALGQHCIPNVDGAAELFHDGHSPMVHARDFDPMVFEAEACRSWAPRLVADDGLLSHFVAQTIAPHVDPMLIESEAIFIPSNPSFVDDMPPSPPLVSQMEALPAVPALEGQAISPALESVCFALQGPAPVLHSSPSLRNITVTRGTRESLLFNLFPDASTPVKETVANFAHAICGDAPPPVLVASPPRRHSRQQPQEFTIRRSERLAKKSHLRATKPTVQAQNVMMKKLGITSDAHPPDASSFQQFTDTFSSTLTDSQCKALDDLLPAGMGSLATDVATPVSVL